MLLIPGRYKQTPSHSQQLSVDAGRLDKLKLNKLWFTVNSLIHSGCFPLV